MQLNQIAPPYPVFTGLDGMPLSGGSVYIGGSGLDPVEYPITVYWDSALTLPAVQPIRTLNGYPVRDGTPANLYTDGSYSIRVLDSKGRTVVNSLTGYSIVHDAVTATVSVYRFATDGVETTFTLPVYVISENNIQAFINGVYQQKDTYSVTGLNVTFTDPPEPGYIELAVTQSLPIGRTDASYVEYLDRTGASTNVQAAIAQLEGMSVSVETYGATGSPTGDDGDAIQAAIDAVAAAGGGVVNLIPNGIHVVNRHIYVKSGVTLKGPLTNPGEILPRPRYLTAVPNSIVLHPDYSIQVATTVGQSNAGITGFYIVNPLVDTEAFPTGLVGPVAPTLSADTMFLNTTGGESVAVKVGAGVVNSGTYNCFVHDVCVYGYTRLIDANYANGFVFWNIRGDCTNGVRIRNISDISRGLGTCHLFPFITVGKGNKGVYNWRNGVGFDLDCQGAYLTDSFSYGHKIGFRLRRDTAVITNCWSDGNPESTQFMATLWGDDSHGFLSEDGFVTTGSGNRGIDHQLIGCGSSSHKYGFTTTLPTSGGAIGRKFTMTACSAWGTESTAHVKLASGIASVQNCNFYNDCIGSASILVESGMVGYDIDHNTFHQSGTTPSVYVDPAVYEYGSVGINNRAFNNYGIATHVTVGSSSGNDHRFVVTGLSGGMTLGGAYAGGSPASKTVPPNGATLFALQGRGYTGATYSIAGGVRVAVDDATPGAASMGGKVIISTCPAGSTTPTDRVVIGNAGNLYPVITGTQNLGTSALQWNMGYMRGITLSALPTSASGLPTGTVWNDAGTLKIA